MEGAQGQVNKRIPKKLESFEVFGNSKNIRERLNKYDKKNMTKT